MRMKWLIPVGFIAVVVLALAVAPSFSTAADSKAKADAPKSDTPKSDATAGSYDPARAQGYNAQQGKQMEAALPDKAFVKPEKPRKLLVYVESKGYYHASIPIVAAAIKGIGDKTGAWETTFGNDPAVFTAENLAKFDGVFMDNTVTESPNTDEGKKALLDFVKGGKGFMACHAGADCNHKWAEYADLIGAEFVAHWWGVIKASNRIEDPTSPLVSMFPKEGFIAWEEIYTFKKPTGAKPQGYNRDKVRVLLSLDVAASKVDPSKGDFKDGDYALSWIKKYGDGRVFYTAYGHQNELMWSKPILAHYLAGIQYALGDLKADDTPSGKKDWQAIHGPDPAQTPLINPVVPAKN
jgi:uncharacterized protein